MLSNSHVLGPDELVDPKTPVAMPVPLNVASTGGSAEPKNVSSPTIVNGVDTLMIGRAAQGHTTVGNMTDAVLVKARFPFPIG